MNSAVEIILESNAGPRNAQLISEQFAPFYGFHSNGLISELVIHESITEILLYQMIFTFSPISSAIMSWKSLILLFLL
jgi:hypothetical protein